MEESFELPVEFRGKEINFPARLRQFGYTYGLEVDIYETTVWLERDEEKNWRIMMPPGKEAPGKLPERELLEAVIEAVDRINS